MYVYSLIGAIKSSVQSVLTSVVITLIMNWWYLNKIGKENFLYLIGDRNNGEIIWKELHDLGVMENDKIKKNDKVDLQSVEMQAYNDVVNKMLQDKSTLKTGLAKSAAIAFVVSFIASFLIATMTY
jgi:hypothetical protein